MTESELLELLVIGGALYLIVECADYWITYRRNKREAKWRRF